jgi:hypothetical protein
MRRIREPTGDVNDRLNGAIHDRRNGAISN